MGKTSTASKNKYNAKAYDQLRIIVKKGEKEQIKAHAERQGLSLNGYVNKLIKDDMQKEQG
ncbi:MAG: antitoxin [Ruminococcus sp.]|nr:antitoxin [Ruminococcus sp.]